MAREALARAAPIARPPGAAWTHSLTARIRSSRVDRTDAAHRCTNYLRDRIKVLNRGDAQFALAAVDLLWHRDPAGIEADDGERKGLHVCGHPRNRLALARKAYEGCDAFTMVVTLVVPGPPAYTLAMYYVCKDPAALKTQATPLGRVARPFFFGDDDTYRDARFKLTPRMLDSNWVVRKAVGQRPAVLGKQLKQWYWRGADLCINQIVAVASQCRVVAVHPTHCLICAQARTTSRSTSTSAARRSPRASSASAVDMRRRSWWTSRS